MELSRHRDDASVGQHTSPVASGRSTHARREPMRSCLSHVGAPNPPRWVVTPFGLQNSRLRASLRAMTTWWRSRHMFALLLAVFVTVGLSVSAVQTNTMFVKMGAMQGMADGASNCSACPKSSDTSGKPMVCPPVCLASAIALPAQQPVHLMSVQAVVPYPAPFSPLRGRDFLPDPYPPRYAI